jgi:precorrin-3B C17-methyltransferase
MQKLLVVGIGPGKPDGMTLEARHALETADVLVGYSAYIALVSESFPDKETIATGMTREQERCKRALALAETGRTVAIVCSGDAGVYGMASLVYELAPGYPSVEISVVPGVSAALAGAAILGAPLSHDFAVISLSDLLTPWEQIEKRLSCAAEGDFCIALYNPSSRKRAGYLKAACEIILRHRCTNTVCGIARRIGRDGEYG